MWNKTFIDLYELPREGNSSKNIIFCFMKIIKYYGQLTIDWFFSARTISSLVPKSRPKHIKQTHYIATDSHHCNNNLWCRQWSVRLSSKFISKVKFHDTNRAVKFKSWQPVWHCRNHCQLSQKLFRSMLHLPSSHSMVGGGMGVREDRMDGQMFLTSTSTKFSSNRSIEFSLWNLLVLSQGSIFFPSNETLKQYLQCPSYAIPRLKIVRRTFLLSMPMSGMTEFTEPRRKLTLKRPIV